MKRRIFGLENEYGLTCTLNGQRRLSPDNVARYLFEKVIPGARNANVFLENSAGTLLATGATGATNLDRVIANAGLSAGGTYYVRVSGSAAVTYSVQVTKNAVFDAEGNDTGANAQTIAGTDLSQYMNPYQSSVVNATLGQLNQLNANQLLNTNQSATASGAFGGARSGVADALTNQYDMQQAAPVIAGLNAQGYNTALNAKKLFASPPPTSSSTTPTTTAK